MNGDKPTGHDWGLSPGRGLLILGLYHCVFLGAGHGVAPIGLMLVFVSFVGTGAHWDTSPVLLLLGWPGMVLLLVESLRARLRRAELNRRVVAASVALLSLSIGGLLLYSDAIPVSLVTAVPFAWASRSVFLGRSRRPGRDRESLPG